MRIGSIDVTSYSTGRVLVNLDSGDMLHVQLTEDESERFRQLATEIFLERQQSIAHEIKTAAPALLSDFTEVKEAATSFQEIDDDVTF